MRVSSRIVVGVVVLIELLMFAYIEMRIMPEFYKWTHATTDEYDHLLEVKSVVESGVPVDVFILGDSTARFGVEPKIFQNLTGLSAWNFGTFRAVNPFVDTYLLRKAIDLGHPPKAAIVILSIDAGSQPVYPPLLLEHFGDDLSIATTLFLHGRFSPFAYVSYAIGRVIPSMRMSTHIRRGLPEAFLKPQEPKYREMMLPMSRGFTPQNIDIAARDNRERDFTKWKLNSYPDTVIMLRELCTLGKTNNIPIYLAIAPFKQKNDIDYMTRADRKLTDLQIVADTPGCESLQRWKTYPEEFMADDVHLNLAGADIFTAQLAEEFSYAVWLKGSTVQN